MRIGAQMFTVRDFCKDLNGISESLSKIADIGYKYVQVSGTCDYDPKWMKAELDKNGLKCVLTHTSAEKLLADPKKIAEDHDILDCRCVGLGWFTHDQEREVDSTEYFLKTYTPFAQELKKYGKYFMYHNHDQEFKKIDNVAVMQILADRMPADLMGFTLDTFWVQAGGGDPALWLEKLSGRVPVIHLKDYAYGRKMAVLGEGNINFDRVFEKAEKSKTEYMLVEQDDCNGEDPFDCFKRSYKYLKSNGFE